MSFTTVIIGEEPLSELHHILEEVADGRHLSVADAGRAFQIIMAGGATPAQIAALLIGLRINGETIEEISGAAMAIRNKAKPFDVPEHLKGSIIDTCGTGGDKKGTYNISTTAAIVAASCGVPVTKHGNKSVSSMSGSSDVLTALSIDIDIDQERSIESLEEAGICFIMAPKYHSAMRHVAPVRKELRLRTIFNLVGPLVNPAKPQRQLLGVYDRKLIEPLANVLDNLGSVHAWVVGGEDGMDEISTMAKTHVAELKDGEIRTFTIDPMDYGIEPPIDMTELQGGDNVENAQALKAMLGGNANFDAYRDAVIINAGAALIIAGKVSKLEDGIEMAREAISSGRAKITLQKMVEVTNKIQ